jgi:hypothetical protein
VVLVRREDLEQRSHLPTFRLGATEHHGVST